jgi:hypothetical protein
MEKIDGAKALSQEELSEPPLRFSRNTAESSGVSAASGTVVAGEKMQDNYLSC